MTFYSRSDTNDSQIKLSAFIYMQSVNMVEFERFWTICDDFFVFQNCNLRTLKVWTFLKKNKFTFKDTPRVRTVRFFEKYTYIGLEQFVTYVFNLKG